MPLTISKSLAVGKRSSLRNKSNSRLDPLAALSPLMSQFLQPPPEVASDSLLVIYLFKYKYTLAFLV